MSDKDKIRDIIKKLQLDNPAEYEKLMLSFNALVEHIHYFVDGSFIAVHVTVFHGMAVEATYNEWIIGKRKES